MTETIFIAKIMPKDEDEPVYCSVIGETREAAEKGAVRKLKEYSVPAAVNFEWDGNHGEYGSWQGVIKEKDLHSVLPGDVLCPEP